MINRALEITAIGLACLLAAVVLASPRVPEVDADRTALHATQPDAALRVTSAVAKEPDQTPSSDGRDDIREILRDMVLHD
jgi:hypothetical protein